MLLKQNTIPCILSWTLILSLCIHWSLGSGQGISRPIKPCCWPNQTTGTMVVTTPNMHVFSITYYADFEQGRSIDIPGEDSGLPMLFQYRDYKNSKRFLMFRDGKCIEYPMVGHHVQCMPDDAEYVNSIQVEEHGKIRTLHSWRFTAPETNGGYQGRLVYEDNCQPFIYRVDDPMVGYKFENVVPRIDDFSVFDVDLTGCEKGEEPN